MERPYLSIGEVLGLLLEEFPDVTISKIRFLETQGLIDPERTPSGYRKFYDEDLDRLRFILREQKDHYLPLRVIKERLDTIDHTLPNPPRPLPIGASWAVVGALDVDEDVPEVPAVPVEPVPAPAERRPAADAPRPSARSAPPVAEVVPPVARPLSPSALAPEPDRGAPSHPYNGETPHYTSRDDVPRDHTHAAVDDRPVPGERSLSLVAGEVSVELTADELCQRAFITRGLLADLESFGLVSATQVAGVATYGLDALKVSGLAGRLAAHGLEPRHLRGWRTAVEREVGLIDQLIQPLLRQRNPQARAQALQRAEDMARLGGDLRAALMRRAIDDLLPG